MMIKIKVADEKVGINACQILDYYMTLRGLIYFPFFELGSAVMDKFRISHVWSSERKSFFNWTATKDERWILYENIVRYRQRIDSNKIPTT